MKLLFNYINSSLQMNPALNDEFTSMLNQKLVILPGEISEYK